MFSFRGVLRMYFPTTTVRFVFSSLVWLLKSVEIVVHSKKFLILQKFQKKLHHFNRNSQLRSVM